MKTIHHWLDLLFNRYRRMTLDQLAHAIFRERATGRSEGAATLEMRRRVQTIKEAKRT